MIAAVTGVLGRLRVTFDDGYSDMGITVFTPAPLPLNDAARSEAAIRSGLLGRVNDPVLLDITKNTRRTFKSRWCGVVLVIGEIQHVIASSDGLVGLFRRSTTFRSYVIYRPKETFVVLDAAADSRFAGNPHVDDGVISFYAGTAIFDSVGYAVGVLCISDAGPRQSFSLEEASLLKSYADAVAATLANL